MKKIITAIGLLARLFVNCLDAVLFRLLVRRVLFRSHEKRPPIILISFIEWQGAFQRPQHLAQELARMGYEVFYFSLLRIHRAVAHPEWTPYTSAQKEEKGLTVVTPLAFPLDSRYNFFRTLNNAILLRNIHRLCNAFQPPFLIVNAPYFNSCVFNISYNKLLYDVMDELTADKMGSRLKADEQILLNGANMVTSGTTGVAELKKGIRPDIRFVSCGVDYDHFARAALAEPEVPEDISHIPHPVVGYFGAVNERIDYALVRTLAEKLPEVNFLYIGPVSVNVSMLSNLANIFFIGWRSYDSLPEYLRTFDIASVPYRLEDGVEYVNPVKILEYLAGGKPVISTDIPDVRRFYGDVVYLAPDAQCFVDHVKHILANPEHSRDKIRHGQELARQRSWHAMAQEFARNLISVF